MSALSSFVAGGGPTPLAPRDGAAKPSGGGGGGGVGDLLSLFSNTDAPGPEALVPMRASSSAAAAAAVEEPRVWRIPDLSYMGATRLV